MSSIAIEQLLQDGQRKLCGFVWIDDRSRSNCFAHYASKERFYSHNFAAKNLVVFFLLLLFFSTFHIKVQHFCFLLKQFFENVKKKKFTVGGFKRGSVG